MSETMTAAEFNALHRAVEKRSSQGAHNPQIVGSNPTGATKGPRSRITYSAPKRPKEESIHIQLCNYVRAKYPDTIFTSESSGIRLTIGQAVKAKKLRSSSKLPDFWLAEPRGTFAGLFLELKRDREEIYLKDGSLSRAAHVQAQEQILERLRLKGYAAGFAGGIDDAIRKVDTYMKS